MSACEFTMDDPGPHPGCREFDPNPGTIGCDDEATETVVVPDPYDGFVILHVCEFHAQAIIEADVDALWQGNVQRVPRDVSLYASCTWEQTPLLRALLDNERPVTAADLVKLHEVFTEGGLDAGTPTFTLREFIDWLEARGPWAGMRGAEVVW